jgi:hypothetical protein
MTTEALVLAKMYEHLSRKGRRYFVGRVGAVMLHMVETGMVDRGSPVWQINISQGSQTTQEEIARAREVTVEDRDKDLGQIRPAADDGAVAS